MTSVPESIASFHPAVRTWFCSQFDSVTEPQTLAFPLIKANQNILLLSPTGSGKTLAGFLASIDYLVRQAEENQLENRVYIIYVSPLRALSNDIKKNLMVPLQGIKKEAPFADIRVLVRTGDTSAYRKSKMLRITPHILITTPETLQIILNAPKFREKLTQVKYVIIDEIHDLCNTKRGVSLSLSLERLQHLAGPLVRIGLSATQAPVEKIAQFLVGVHRDVRILIAEREKKYDLSIIKPHSLSQLSLEKAVDETYDILKDLIETHNVTIVFSNTRSRTERIVYQLKKRDLFSVAAHHGSMGKDTRHHIEHLLKQGSIKSVITSTSLELGIDIGDVDLVVQLGSPKNTAKLMQRIGRAGHGLGAVSEGVLIAQDRDELVDLEILKRKALSYKLEPVQIPQNCLDVLAQHLIGMSLEKIWNIQEAYQLVRKSFCYQTLEYEDFVKVLEYLGGYYADLEEKHIYRKLWFDGENFGRTRSAIYLYFQNCGTIPSQATFKVVLDGIPLGTLSDYFVSHLNQKDVFILGGRSLEFVRVEGMNVVVKDTMGGKPTVPSWRGEAMSRSYEFAFDLSAFREYVYERLQQNLQVKSLLDQDSHEKVKDVENADARNGKDASRDSDTDDTDYTQPPEKELVDEEPEIDPDICSYFEEQIKVAGFIPTAHTLHIERYIDADHIYHLIFHAPFGRRVNEALARGYGQKLGCSDFTVTDNGFMLNSKRALQFKEDILVSEEFIDIIKASVWGTELFCQRFRHCAERGFLLLKTYKGKSISPRTQYFRARSLLKELPFDFPIVKETFNEVLYSALDCEHAVQILRNIEDGTLQIAVSEYTTIPSPFALSIVMAGAQDIITLKDRSEFLQHMQKAVTERIIEARPAFDAETVENYFAGRERIYKRGEIEQKVKSGEVEVESVILDMLSTQIMTAQEIADELGFDEKEIESILDDLIEKTLVSCGYFTAPQLQYMLVKDRRLLEYGEGFEDLTVRKVLMEKHFSYDSAKDMICAYGYIRSKRAVYDRVGFFSQPLLRIKIRGRLGYILPEDAQLFVSAYREDEPGDQEEILEFIRAHPGLKRKEIVKACESDFSRLEDHLYVCRDEENRFYPLDITSHDKKEAQKEIIRRYITSCGPVSKEEIMYHTRILDVEDILSEYEQINVFSKIVQKMYCTREDYHALIKKGDKEDREKKSHLMRIIDHTDPLYEKIQHETSSLLGEAFSPLLVDGTIKGGILYHANEHFCIEEVTLLSDMICVEAFFKEIQRVYRFYRWQGSKNIIIKPESLKEMAKTAGFHLEEETLVDAPEFSHSLQDVYTTQLHHQWLVTKNSAEEVLKLPFLDENAFSKRCYESLSELLQKEQITTVEYNGHTYVCAPEDKQLYTSNNVAQLVKNLLNSFVIVSPFQIKNLVDAELFEIEEILKENATCVYYKQEIYYLKEENFISSESDELHILFLPVSDPYIVLHNHEWELEGTAILLNGSPAGYYTKEEDQADLYLFKEWKEYWGNILVKLPSEHILIRTINGRPVKDTRFARRFV